MREESGKRKCCKLTLMRSMRRVAHFGSVQLLIEEMKGTCLQNIQSQQEIFF
jgi:hypothetical protein